jgi:predicted nuclease of predicted toxin-antitoxin system
MTRRFFKHKILLDENVYSRSKFPILNSLFDVKHITEDYNQAGLKDPQVYKLAVKEGRILVTFNTKDFRELATTSQKIGVIGLSIMTPNVADKKLTALFRKSTTKFLLGKLTTLTGETEI